MPFLEKLMKLFTHEEKRDDSDNAASQAVEVKEERSPVGVTANTREEHKDEAVPLVTDPEPENLDKENHTQLEDLGGDDKQRQLVIGLDFGTAFTKVVIAELRVAYAVPFESLSNSSNKYLLPGVLSISASGECHLGKSKDATRTISNLKMRLLQGDTSLSCQIEIAAFLALVLRYSRTWLMSTHRKTYQGTKIDWNLNVGLPTHNYHDDDLTAVYRRIVETAWQVSVLSEPVTIVLVSKAIGESPWSSNIELRRHEEDGVPKNYMHPDSIGLFPEFVAQITGYVRSPLRQDDLHALVDIGAGTVDVTVFNVHAPDGEDKFPIFAKSVKPLGVEFLMFHRLEESQYDGNWLPEAQENPPTDSEFANILGISEELLTSNIDAPFRSKLTQQIFSQLALTRAHRYPLSRRWQTGIPMFWCGGGAKAEFYSRLFSMIEETSRYPVNRVFLPKPDKLLAEGLAGDEYDRLSVAYGLSFDQFDIGEIFRTDEVSDVQRDSSERAGGICFTCNGTGGWRGNDCRTCGGSGVVT